MRQTFSGDIPCPHCFEVSVYKGEEVYTLNGDDEIEMLCKSCGERIEPQDPTIPPHMLLRGVKVLVQHGMDNRLALAMARRVLQAVDYPKMVEALRRVVWRTAARNTGSMSCKTLTAWQDTYCMIREILASAGVRV